MADEKQVKRYGFRLGAIPLTKHTGLQDQLTKSESTTKYQLRAHAISSDVIEKYADTTIDSSDAGLTIMRGPLNSFPVSLGLENTAWNLPSVSSAHHSVATASILIAVIYPLIQLQLTVEDVEDANFNKDPAKIFAAHFLKNPEDCLQKIQAHLDDIYKRSPTLQQECTGLSFNYEITPDQQLELYLCIQEKPHQLAPAKPTSTKKAWHFLTYDIKNFAINVDDGLYIPALFYWLAWGLIGIIWHNSTNFIIPGPFWLSTILALGVPFTFAALLYSKKIFIWINNHFYFPQFGVWNTWIKPYFDNTLTFWQKMLRLPVWLIFMVTMPFIAIGAWYRSDWGKYGALKWVFGLTIVPLICQSIASLCGVSGKKDNDVYYLPAKAIDNTPQFKDKYRNSYIIIKPSETLERVDISEMGSNEALIPIPIESNKLYYVDQNGILVETPLKMAEIPQHIREKMEQANGANLSGTAREWINREIATNNGHERKAASLMAEKFAAITRELAILNQYDNAERQAGEISAPITRAAHIDTRDGKSEFDLLADSSLHGSSSLLDQKSSRPFETKQRTPQPPNLTGWVMPPETAKPIETIRFNWLTFIGRVSRVEYEVWFSLTVLVYVGLVAVTAANGFFGNMLIASIPMIIVGFLYASVKTYHFIKEKNAYAKQQSGPDIYVVEKLPETTLTEKYYGSYIFEKHTNTACYIYPQECDFALISKAGRPDINLFSRNTYIYNSADNTFYYVDKSRNQIKTIATQNRSSNITTARLCVLLELDKDNFNQKDTAPKFLIENLSAEQLEKLQRITGHQHPKGTRINLPNPLSPATWERIPTEIPFSLTTPLQQRLTAQQQQYVLPLLWNQISSNKGHENQEVFRQQTLLQNIARLKDQVSQQKTALALLKLKLAAKNCDIPADPDIPDATVLENLTSLKRKIRFSSTMIDFLRNPYWAGFAFVSVYFINSIFVARLFTVEGTGVTTALIQAPLVNTLSVMGISFSPLVALAALLVYMTMHALMGIYKKRQEDKDTAKKQQYALAPLQETCLERQLAVLEKHQQKLHSLLSLQEGLSFTPADVDETTGKNLEYIDLYPEPDLLNFAIRRNWRDRIVYLLAGLALTCLLSVFALSFVPAFASLLSLDLILSTCVPIVAVSIFALFGHFWSKDHTLHARERRITIFLLIGLTVSLGLLVALYAAPIAIASNVVYFSWPSAFLAAVFFVTTFKKEDNDIFLADEFLDQKAKELNTLFTKDYAVLLQGNDKELMLHTITLLLTAMNPKGSGRRINAKTWGGNNTILQHSPEEQMLYDFAHLQRLQQQINDEESIPTTILKETADIIMRYNDSPSQAELIRSKKPAVNKQLFIETISLILLIIAGCLTIYLPAVFSLPATVQWLLTGTVIACIVPRMITERFIQYKQRDLVLMSEEPTISNTGSIEKNTFVLCAQKLFYVDKSQGSTTITPIDTPDNYYDQLRTTLGFTELNDAHQISKRAIENVSCATLFSIVPNAKKILRRWERLKFAIAWFSSIRIFTTILLTVALIALLAVGVIFPIVAMLGGYATIPAVLLAPIILASLFLMQAILKYITLIFNLKEHPIVKWWASAASRFFLVLDMIALSGLAFGLPITAFLLLTGVFIIPTTIGFIGVLCALPASFFIFKILLPRVLIAYSINEKDELEKIATQKEDIETGCRNIGYGISFAMFIAAIGLVWGAGFPSSLLVICATWVAGLLAGHYVPHLTIRDDKSSTVTLHQDTSQPFVRQETALEMEEFEPLDAARDYVLIAEKPITPTLPRSQSSFPLNGKPSFHRHPSLSSITKTTTAPATSTTSLVTYMSDVLSQKGDNEIKKSHMLQISLIESSSESAFSNHDIH